MKKLSVGITGYTGFMGSHLVDRLSREKDIEVVPVDDDLFKGQNKLEEKIKDCDCIVHLAGMNRGKEDEIYETNVGLANTLVSALERINQTPHVIFSSSILSSMDSAFGRSKKESCQILGNWGTKHKAPVSLLTIPNVFGDRGRPFYNSVVATFCYQLARGEQPKIIQDREVEFIYINDLIELIFDKINKQPSSVDEVRVKGTKRISMSELLKVLEGFRKSYFSKKVVPELSDRFLADLYNVFLSYLDYDKLVFTPDTRSDNRGKLYEIIRLDQGGEIFFSTTKPGITRGNHYHTRKIERFCVIKGEAAIRMRRIGTDEVREFKIDSSRPSFIEIPIFHTHHIENTGKEDLYTLFWCNELYDPGDSDTFHEEVYKS